VTLVKSAAARNGVWSLIIANLGHERGSCPSLMTYVLADQTVPTKTADYSDLTAAPSPCHSRGPAGNQSPAGPQRF
jgi:hypothetical protein